MESQNIDALITRSEEITNHLNQLLDEDGRTLIAMPAGFELKDLEKFEERRRAPRGTYNTSNFTHFLEYTSSQSDEFEKPIVFIDPESMRATVIFDWDDGLGHARTKAYWDARLTPIVDALTNISLRDVSQRSLIAFLEDWSEEGVSIFDTDGADMSVSEAINCLSSLTVEKAKTIKQKRGDFEYEHSTSEQAAIKKDARMVSRIRITDEIYVGTENALTVEAKLSLIVCEDGFNLGLRITGFDALKLSKVKEIQERATKDLLMPVYAGSYDPR